ncbi:hypothetical protein [Burkholderia sp. IMCC1007]|nr:hypothetical protein [Burkholderia sp. IMCC1007]
MSPTILARVMIVTRAPACVHTPFSIGMPTPRRCSRPGSST